MDNTLVEGKIPDWVADMFKKVDGKDLKGASVYFSDTCDFYFGHLHLLPGPAGVFKFMGAFDAQFPKYRHLIEECWAGPELVEFGGRVQFTIDDGTVVETPFYNRFFFETSSGQPRISKGNALVDLSALPAKYWQQVSALARPK
ncbi:MAG TPA: hypothetical protein VMU53_18110 [Candidatus Sulfotelmatobacter sp.]|nr:hypothetical protein [Candidatus Sulfotelmatobacter sp.]